MTRPIRLAVSGTLAALLTLGAALRAVFLLWHPSFTLDFFDYASVLPHADSWYAMHFLVGAPGFVLLFASFAVVTVALCRLRPAAALLALLGGVVALIGAMAFAFGLAGEGAAWGWALDERVLDPSDGAVLLRGIEGRAALTSLPIAIASVAIIPVGVLLQLVALLVARSVPRLLPVATLVVLVVSALPLPVPGAVGVLIVLQSVALVLIGAVLVRREARQPVPQPG